MSAVWNPAQMRSLASLADAVGFDFGGAATQQFAKNLRAQADHLEANCADDQHEFDPCDCGGENGCASMVCARCGAVESDDVPWATGGAHG